MRYVMLVVAVISVGFGFGLMANDLYKGVALMLEGVQ